MVIRFGLHELFSPGESGWDRIDIGDGAWGKHGAGGIHWVDETGIFEMRGDTMAVGDIDEVSDRPWSKGIKAGGHHGGRAGWEFHPGVVYGYGPDMCHSSE